MTAHRETRNAIIVHAKQTLQYLNSIRVDKPVLNLAKLEKSVVFGRLFHEFSTLQLNIYIWHWILQQANTLYNDVLGYDCEQNTS